MKKLIIALAALMVSAAAYGQGQFNFNNRVGTEVNARFVLSTDAANTSSIGSPDWTVKLTGGAPGGPLAALTPDSTGFRGAAGTSSAGFVTQISPTVAGVAAGSPAAIGVTVLGPGGVSQSFGPYTVSLGGGTITPPNLPLGTSPLVVTAVPEPTTLALGLLGLGSLLFIRRRK